MRALAPLSSPDGLSRGSIPTRSFLNFLEAHHIIVDAPAPYGEFCRDAHGGVSARGEICGAGQQGQTLRHSSPSWLDRARKLQLLVGEKHESDHGRAVVATSMLRRDNFVRMLGQVAGRGAWAAAQIRNALFAYSSTTGALSILYAAAATEIERHSISGELIVPVATRWPAHHRMANDASFGAALWSWSEKQTREALRRRR